MKVVDLRDLPASVGEVVAKLYEATDACESDGVAAVIAAVPASRVVGAKQDAAGFVDVSIVICPDRGRTAAVAAAMGFHPDRFDWCGAASSSLQFGFPPVDLHAATATLGEWPIDVLESVAVDI